MLLIHSRIQDHQNCSFNITVFFFYWKCLYCIRLISCWFKQNGKFDTNFGCFKCRSLAPCCVCYRKNGSSFLKCFFFSSLKKNIKKFFIDCNNTLDSKLNSPKKWLSYANEYVSNHLFIYLKKFISHNFFFLLPYKYRRLQIIFFLLSIEIRTNDEHGFLSVQLYYRTLNALEKC